MGKSEKLVKVYVAKGEAEALIIKGLLECNGIHAILSSNAAPSVLAFSVDGLGEYRVMVPESKAEEARGLIREKKGV